MSDKLANTVPEEGLRRFAESCVLSPSILARRLKLKENEIEQIKYAYPHDRYEQIYQVLLKWSQVNTVVTWKDLIDATDSGIKRVLEDLYDKQDDDIDNIDTEEYIPKRPHVDDSKGPIPTAPPFCDVFIQSSTNKDYGPFSEVDDTILTYDNSYGEVIDALGHETQWYDLGLALKLKPSLLDEIKETCLGKIAECRKEMIKEWLKNSNPLYYPSWRRLCRALKEPIVSNNALANRIAHKYKQIM